MDEFKRNFDKLVSESKSIMICSHIRPDSDAIGSSLAMFEYLCNHTKSSIRVCFESPVNDSFSHLPHFENVEWKEDISDYLNDSDLVIFLDGNIISRFTIYQKKLSFKGKTICIDHHSSEGGAYDLQMVDNSYSATCQLLLDLFYPDNKDLNSSAITLLMEGIMGDTGNITYIRRSNAKVLSDIQRLVEVGDLDIESIKLKTDVFSEKTFPVFQELIKNTSTANIKEGVQNITFSYLSKDFIGNLADKSAVKEPKYQALILRHIENSPWGFVVRPDEKLTNTFNISFRSTKEGPNVRLICEKYFNGGGHNQAAGGTYVLSLQEESFDSIEVCNRVVEILREVNIELNS